MKCEQIQPILLDYGRGLLSGPEANRVREHLNACAACKAVLEEELVFASKLELVPAEEPANDVWALVRVRTKPRSAPLRVLSGLVAGRRLMRTAFALTAAAAVLVGIFYTGMKQENSAPTLKPTNAAVVVKWSDDPLGSHSDAVVKLIDEM